MRKILLLFCIAVLPAMWSAVRADTLTTKDGIQHEGNFVSGSTTIITFRENGRLMRYRTNDIDWLQFGERYQSSSSGYGGRPDFRGDNNYNAPDRGYGGSRDYDVIPRGTPLVLRTDETIDSETSRPDRFFSAHFEDDVLDEYGNVLVPRGSYAQLVIQRISTPGARTAEMALDVDSISVGNQTYAVDTTDLETRGNSGLGSNKRTGQYVGGGTVLGAIIGAIAGGGKGAAIGAISGAAVGAGAQVLTKGSRVRVPAESILTFRLDQPVHLHLRR